MLARQAGLTKTYNLVFDPAVTNSDIVELRAIHKAIDEATVRAYDGTTSSTASTTASTPPGATSATRSAPSRSAILDRLLELNHERYAEEVAKGLHDKKKARTTRAPEPADAEGLF